MDSLIQAVYIDIVKEGYSPLFFSVFNCRTGFLFDLYTWFERGLLAPLIKFC